MESKVEEKAFGESDEEDFVKNAVTLHAEFSALGGGGSNSDESNLPENGGSGGE